MNEILLLVVVILGLPSGLVIGWSVDFIIWYLRKGNLEWAWLLCKPTQLTDREQLRLSSFYETS